MKLSTGIVKEAFVVERIDTGRRYDCFLQDYEWDSGKHETRFNIGINGWREWTFIHYVNEEQFNKEYRIV